MGVDLVIWRVVPLWVCVNMLSSEWSEEIEGDEMAREVEDGEVRVVYMNVGGSGDATHEFL